MSRMRRAVSTSSFASAQWMKGTQEYIEWGTVKRIVKKQLAKAVSECKTQAANAKQLVGDLKSRRLSSGHDLRNHAGTGYDFEDDFSDIDDDTDFESEDDEEDISVPVGVMPSDKGSASPDYDCRHSPSDPKDDVSSLGSDASSYASASSNGLLASGGVVKRFPLPRPAIPTKPAALRSRRQSTARPTAQPPPPPIPTQPPPAAAPSESSEDYEVPICHETYSETSSNLYDEQSTYEQIEHLEQTYEEVREGKITTSPSISNKPLTTATGQKIKDALPKPPLLPRQNSNPLGLLPAPPRPKALKPSKTSPSPLLHRATPFSEKSYDSVSLSSLVNRPLPPVPTVEDVYADVNCQDEAPRHELSVYPWFHDVEREDVEKMLREIGEQGCFLVRVSRRGGPSRPYTLSLLHEGRIFHLLIRKRPDDTFALGSEKPKEKVFKMVSDLIEYHRQEEILLTSRNQSAGSTRLTETHHV
ncbi:lymphocyte cytosolic protein 2 [Galendromus occidentalis]|uniref:Lymphocyte cytosolic protein 2 n=1 Tax=Galendromus occidentalis TaxID=34638 RepID=A0AAJ7L4U3_9ACAR|nr:lymphocyte cytosolic protein 2 [Galendromus occidentalis]